MRTSEGKETATAVNVGGSLEFVRCVTDYEYRNEALEHVPAYFYLMLFDKNTNRVAAAAVDVEEQGEVPAEAAAGTSAAAAAGPPRPLPKAALEPFDFRGAHPQRLSHTMVLRPQLYLPQAIGNYPAEPGADADRQAKEIYAAWILSMLVPWVVVDRLCKELGLFHVGRV